MGDGKLDNFFMVMRGGRLQCLMADLDFMRLCAKTKRGSKVARFPLTKKQKPLGDHWGDEFVIGKTSYITVQQDIYAFGDSINKALDLIASDCGENGERIRCGTHAESFLESFEEPLRKLANLCKSREPTSRPTAGQLFRLFSNSGTDVEKLGVAIANLAGELLSEDF